MARNVVYFLSKNSQIPLAGIANLPYTDVIVAFLYPDANGNLQLGGDAFKPTENLQSDIRTLQNAGKNVLLSFGGSGVQTAAYQKVARNMQTLVNGIVANVNLYGFNGVDIDYEDNAGFQGAYDGLAFLNGLTSGLATSLPPGRNIITHAPQTAYWDNSGSQFKWKTGGTAPYAFIWKEVGYKIAWINNQFYNTPYYDKDDPTKVTWYKNIAAITGPQKLLMGVLLKGGTGIVGLPDMVQTIIPQLKGAYGTQFGGVMTWQFSFDNGGSWAQGISQALA